MVVVVVFAVEMGVMAAVVVDAGVAVSKRVAFVVFAGTDCIAAVAAAVGPRMVSGTVDVADIGTVVVAGAAVA